MILNKYFLEEKKNNKNKYYNKQAWLMLDMINDKKYFIYIKIAHEIDIFNAKCSIHIFCNKWFNQSYIICRFVAVHRFNTFLMVQRIGKMHVKTSTRADELLWVALTFQSQHTKCQLNEWSVSAWRMFLLFVYHQSFNFNL